MSRMMSALNIMNIKADLSQHGIAFGGAMESTGHAWAMSLQNCAIFTSTDMYANFHEFSAPPHQKKAMAFYNIK